MAFWNKGDTEAYEVADVPHFIRRGPKLPDDFEQRLTETLEQDMKGYAMVQRTAAVIAQEIEHLRRELDGARDLVKQGEAKEIELVAELTKTLDEEVAAAQARHLAELAEIERLRGTVS